MLPIRALDVSVLVQLNVAYLVEPALAAVLDAVYSQYADA